jgi:rhodanese-related sulfurtransferase
MHVRQIIGVGLAIGAATVLPGLTGCQQGTSEKDINEGVVLSLADVRDAIDRRDGGEPERALMIDPRAPKYFDAGHLPGAVNLRLPDVREEDPKDPDLQRFSRLIVYGENPGTAVARAMFKRLHAIGYGGVKFYAGGLDEWARSGGQIEVSTPPEPETQE